MEITCLFNAQYIFIISMTEFSLFFIYTTCLTIALLYYISLIILLNCILYLYYFLIILFIINLKNVNKTEYYLKIFQISKKIFYIFVILKI